MARFWVLLFIVWYRAFTVVRTEDLTQLTSLNPLDSALKTSKDDNDNMLSNDQETTSNSKSELYYGGRPEYKDEEVEAEIGELMRAINLMPLRTLYDIKLGNLGNEQTSPNDEPLGQNLEYNIGDDYEDYKPFKRTFHTWGGKRSDTPMTYQDKRGQDGIKLAPKRPSFHSWGGKRSENLGNLFEIDDESVSKKNLKKKMPFNSWGGKRNYDSEAPPDNILKEYVDYVSPMKDMNVMGRRRLKFNSWGGKRSFKQVDETQMNDNYKRNFHAWGGK